MARSKAQRESELLRKLSKALYNETDENAMDKLRRNMASFARNMERSNSSRTHETVNGWFRHTPRGFPDEVNNYRFVLEYARSAAKSLHSYAEASKNANRILEPVFRACNKKIRSAEEKSAALREVNFHARKDFLYIRQGLIPHHDNEVMLKNSLGLYETIRQPSSELEQKILTREFIEIFHRDGILTIDWYFRADESSVHKFSGHYILTGDTAWFFLFNSKFKGRFRVMASRDHFWKEKGQKFGRGLLLAQKPFFNEMQSASRKVVIHRLGDSEKFERPREKMVSRLSITDIEDRKLASEVEEFLLSKESFGVDV